jgi:hypothetical protein
LTRFVGFVGLANCGSHGGGVALTKVVGGYNNCDSVKTSKLLGTIGVV